jgi:hypothetical protein
VEEVVEEKLYLLYPWYCEEAGVELHALDARCLGVDRVTYGIEPIYCSISVF